MQRFMTFSTSHVIPITNPMRFHASHLQAHPGMAAVLISKGGSQASQFVRDVGHLILGTSRSVNSSRRPDRIDCGFHLYHVSVQSVLLGHRECTSQVIGRQRNLTEPEQSLSQVDLEAYSKLRREF